MSARSQMRPTKRLTALVSKLSTVRMIDELSLHPAYARCRPNMGQGDVPAVCSPLLWWARGVRRFWFALLASPLLLRRQSSDLWVNLCQSKTRGRNNVKRQRRFGTEVDASIAAAQIKTLIDSLRRCQQSLDCDIATEEERTRCSDDSDPAYSVFARSLIPRRDNVAATIAILREHLSKTELLISTGIGSVPEQLLPA